MRDRRSEDAADALDLAGADVLARHRADREAERHHRQEQRLDQPQSDPEPRLRRGAERPAHLVDDEQVDRGQRELGARGQTDLEHAPPDRQLRPPVGRSKVEVLPRGNEVRAEPDDADHDRDERGDRGSSHAHRVAGEPAEDQDRGQQHVQDHRGGLDDHPRLEVAGAAQGRAHRHHCELQRHRRNEPEQIVGGERGGLGIGAQRPRVRNPHRHHHHQERQAGDHRQDL